MGISVSKAMGIGGLIQCKVVAGTGGMEREISYVTVMEVPDTIQWLKGEDLLLTSLYPIKDDPEALSKLVSQLVQKGSAALAIKTNRFIDRIPEVIINEANRLDFPIIEIEKDIPYLDITTPLMTEILKNSSAHRDLEEVFRWISDLALEGKGIDAILQALLKIVDNMITLESEIPFIKSYTPYDLVPLDNHHKSQLKKMNRPIRTSRLLNGTEIPCIIAPLILNKEVQGYLTCWETNRNFQKNDFAILERVIPLLAFEFLKVKTKLDVEQKYKDEFLAEFLNGKLTKPEEVIEKAKIYKWDLLTNYVVYVLNIDQFNEVIKQFNFNEVLIQEYKANILRKLKTIIPQGSAAIVGSWSDDFIILYPYQILQNKQQGNFKKNTYTFIEKVLIRNKELFPEISFTAGIGRYVKGLQGLQAGYKDAILSIKLGRKIWGRNKIIHYDDLGIYRLLCQFKHADEFRDLYKETVDIIVDYDLKNNANLTETLDKYFNNNCGLKETAKEMFIHVNTLKYRLQKIEQLTGLNLATSEGRLQLHLGIKFHHILHLL